jgi:hypothetical protein
LTFILWKILSFAELTKKEKKQKFFFIMHTVSSHCISSSKNQIHPPPFSSPKQKEDIETVVFRKSSSIWMMVSPNSTWCIKFVKTKLMQHYCLEYLSSQSRLFTHIVMMMLAKRKTIMCLCKFICF